MKFQHSISMLVLLVMLVGCSDEGLVGVHPADPVLETEETVAAAKRSKTVPTRGRFSSEQVGNDAPSRGCDPIAGFVVIPASNVLTGVGTHVGNFRAVSKECAYLPLDADFPAGEFLIRNGETTTITANEDQFYSTYEGQGTFSPDLTVGLFKTESVITGGTGRFAGLTGSFTSSGTFNPSLPNPCCTTGEGSWEGRIAVPGHYTSGKDDSIAMEEE